MYYYTEKSAGLDRLTGPEKLLDEEDSLIIFFGFSTLLKNVENGRKWGV